MRAIWIGGVFSDKALSQYRAVNQAQNRWSLGLIRELKVLGWSFHSLAFRADQLWPKGDLHPGTPEDFHPAVSPLLVPTWNLPFIRSLHLPGAYLRRLRDYVTETGAPDCVVTYNPLKWHVPAAEWAARNGIPWISITLDLKHPGKNMENFITLNKHASAQVVLSWWGYHHCPLGPKLHLDGGYDDLHADEANYGKAAKKVILYSGKYTDYGGTALLGDIIESCKRTDVEFWLFGKGESTRIESLSRSDPRVRRYGFVSNEELCALCRRAHIFLNPRPSSFADNKMTYPSKLLFYMSFGKPIISTWTPGLAPEYRPFLTVPTSEDGSSFSRSIDYTLEQAPATWLAVRDRMLNFLSTSRTWRKQAQRFDGLARHCLSKAKR